MEEIKKDYNEKITALEPLSIKRPPKPEPKPEAPKPGPSIYTISFCLLFLLHLFAFCKFWEFSKLFSNFYEKFSYNFPIFREMISQILDNWLETFQFSKSCKKQMNETFVERITNLPGGQTDKLFLRVHCSLVLRQGTLWSWSQKRGGSDWFFGSWIIFWRFQNKWRPLRPRLGQIWTYILPKFEPKNCSA